MKKAIFLLVVIASIAKLSFCQKQGQEKIDSLFTALQFEKEDTAKVNAFNTLACEIAIYNPDTAIHYASKALALAKEVNYEIGIANAYNNIGFGLSFLGIFKEALKNFNDALMVYDELLISSAQANKSKILKGKGNVYNNIGNVYDDQSDYAEALKNNFTALKIYQEIVDKRELAKTYNNIGIIYENLGDYAEALINYFAALKLNEELGNIQWKVYNLNNIGGIYRKQGDYDEALKNYFTALKINEEFGNKRETAGNLNNIGIIYSIQGRYTEALDHFFAALKINEEFGNKLWKAINLVNIGTVYFNQGNYANALENHSAALKISEEIGNKNRMAICYNNIASDYMKLKKISEASRSLKNGFKLAKEVGSLSDIKDSYLGFSGLDSLQGNFKQSLENYKMYIIYRDSLVNDENLKKTMQIQMQYEFDKRESLAKAEQEKKDAIALEELQKQKLIRNGFVGGFSVLLIFAVIISIIMRQREKIKLIKKERNRISRELHDDIGAELTRITVISQHLRKKTTEDDEMYEKLGKISEAGKKVLGSIGEIIWTMNTQKNNLESIFAYIRRYVSEYLEMNGIEVSIEFPDKIPVNSVSDEYRRNIFLVIKEAIYNITKHSKATRVRVSMNFRKRWAECEISDNGTGFSVNEKQNWGNGLTNMNQRMKDIGGNFQISSDKNHGTLIRLTFPVR